MGVEGEVPRCADDCIVHRNVSVVQLRREGVIEHTADELGKLFRIKGEVKIETIDPRRYVQLQVQPHQVCIVIVIQTAQNG